MRFYDCDDESQFEVISSRVQDDGLVGGNQIQVFAPDTPVEAMNRGFRPAVSAD
jgi:hypothetical protein